MQLTELIVSQARTTAVMCCCGVLVYSLWTIKKYLQQAAPSRAAWIIWECGFWAAAAAAVSGFMYYCTFGAITFHGAAGFLVGLLLWKKICCGIISSWEKRDAAENSETTARSLTWTRREKNVWRRGVRKEHARRKTHGSAPDRIPKAKWPSEDRKTEEGF